MYSLFSWFLFCFLFYIRWQSTINLSGFSETPVNGLPLWPRSAWKSAFDSSSVVPLLRAIVQLLNWLSTVVSTVWTNKTTLGLRVQHGASFPNAVSRMLPRISGENCSMFCSGLVDSANQKSKLFVILSSSFFFFLGGGGGGDQNDDYQMVYSLNYKFA